LGKFNVALYCFCGGPTGTLVDSSRGNPNVRPLGRVLGDVRENPGAPSRGNLDSGRLIYMVPLAHPSSHPKRHLDRFSRFCRAHGRYRQTDRKTDHVSPPVIIGRIYS